VFSHRKCTNDVLRTLKKDLEKVFRKHLLGSKDWKNHKLEESIVELIAGISTKCEDEDLEDLLFFMIDSFRNAGLSVLADEVDVDQVSASLRFNPCKIFDFFSLHL
jgi:separase